MSSRWVHFLGTIQTYQKQARVKEVLGEPICFEWKEGEDLIDEMKRRVDIFYPLERKALEKFKKGEGILPGLKWQYVDMYKYSGHTLGEGALIVIEGDIPDVLYEINGGIQKVIDWFKKSVTTLSARESMLKIDEEISDEIILVTGQFDKTQIRRFKKTNEFRKEDD